MIMTIDRYWVERVTWKRRSGKDIKMLKKYKRLFEENRSTSNLSCHAIATEVK